MIVFLAVYLLLSIWVALRLGKSARSRLANGRWLRNIAGSFTALFAFASAVIILDRLVAPHLIPDDFAGRQMDEIRSSMRIRGPWRPLGKEDLPPPKSANEFVIGIFGGSVAFQLAVSQGVLENPEAIEFAKRVGKPLRLVNVTMSGTREPHQFNALHLFHDSIDAAVFLDGINEMRGDGAESCDKLAEFWAANRKSPLELLQPLIALNARLHAIADSPYWDYLKKSWLFKLYLARLDDQDEFETWELGQWMGTEPSRPWFAGAKDSAKAWAGCVGLSSSFARSVGLPAFFFLQPDQFVAGSKPFSDEEMRVSFQPLNLAEKATEHAPDWAKKMLHLVPRDLTSTYAEYDSQIAELRAQDVPVFSLAQVFKDVHETVYTDDCCHVNRRGNEVMARAIFAQLLKAAPFGK